MATWAARLPAIRDELHLTTGHLGFVLLALSIGSVSMLPFAGAVVRLLGAARTVVAASGLAMFGFVLVGLSTTVWMLALGLYLTGSGIGAWDVAMNVEGAEVERRLGRSIMPRFHAAFSLGTVVGAGGGALAAAGHLSVHVNLPVVAIIVALSAGLASRNFLAATPGPICAVADLGGAVTDLGDAVTDLRDAVTDLGDAVTDLRDPVGDLPGPVADLRQPVAHPRDLLPDLGDPVTDPREPVPSSEPARPGAGSSLVTAWLEPLTLLIGVLVFSMALSEGAANDWLALGVVDGYGATDAVGALCFGVFVTGMTAMRTLGPRLLDRYDHVLVMRSSALAVLLGTGLVVTGAQLADHHASGPLYALAVLGALCWGFGSALGFPMGMTAAAADPEHSATRVGVVSTIGYTAFLAGPPLLGNLGQRIGTAQSLVAISVAVLLSLATAGAVRQKGVPA